MKLNAPKRITWLIGLILVVLGLIGSLSFPAWPSGSCWWRLC